MQSGMSVCDLTALLLMDIPGIYSSLFVLWLCLDTHSAMNYFGPGMYSILTLYCCICSSFFEAYVIGL